MSLASLSLLTLASRPVQAQGLPQGWVAVPCDAQGNPLSYASQDNAGFYEMNGTESWNIANTYPKDLVAAAKANPSNYSSFLNGIYPLIYLDTDLYPDTSGPIRYGGIGSTSSSGNPLGAGANNYYNDYSTQWYYSLYSGSSPSGGLINGSVTVDITGQLVYYFKVTWQGSGPQPKMPDHLDLLLHTKVGAGAGVDYGSSGQTSGLSAKAKASDDAFSETASADGSDTTVGPGYVSGYHLVRASVDPGTGIAETFLNGTTHWEADDEVPYGTYTPSDDGGDGVPTNGGTGASSSSSVQAGVSQDSREVSISCPTMDSPFANNLANNYYKGVYDSQHGTDRYQHPRLLANNSVDSVVFQNNDPVSGQQFIAGATYDSGAAGFISPKYTWKISGDGTPDANTSAGLGPSPTNPNGLVNLPANLSFGSTWDTTTTKSSQFTVSVQDSDGATAADTYSVTWHAPAEKFRVLSFQHMVPQLVGTAQAIALNTSVPQSITIPGQEGEIDWGAVQQNSGLPVAVAGTGAGGALLIPEVASGPWGWAAIAFQAVAAGASYKLGMSSPDHPGTVQIQGNANYAEYVADVQHQIDTNTIPGDSDNMPCFFPPSLAAQAKAAEQSPSGWTLDPYFLSCTATWQGGWYMEVKDLEGDSYGVNGYTGPVDGHTSVATALFKHFVWTCTYIKPPTN